MRGLPRTIGTALAAGVLLSGCAAASSAGAGTGSGSPSPSTAASSAPSSLPQTGTTSLTVVADEGNGGPPQRWTLTCDPVGGSHPNAAAACGQLVNAAGDPFAPTPPGLACSMIYGGPQEAHVYGTFEGRAVDTKFQRTNGCQVARWARVSELLVLRGASGLQQ